MIIPTSGSHKERDDVINEVPNTTKLQRRIVPPRNILEANVVVHQTSYLASDDILSPKFINRPLHERAPVPHYEREIIMQYVTKKRIRASIIDQFVRVFNCPPAKDWKKGNERC